jgi:hypothetical protein
MDMLKLRARTSHAIRTRIRAALGPRPDAAAGATLEALYMDALLDAGLGYASISRNRDTTEQVIHRILHRR